MGSLARTAAAIATILVREGVDYAQSKAVFKAARQRAGLHAPVDRRGGVDRLTVEEELRFLDQAYAQDGRTGLMLQTLLETGARASELVQFRIEDVSLAERVVVIRHGKGDKRREVPIRRDLAQLLRLHEVAVLAIAKTGVDFPPRKRLPLSLLSSLGPLQGILQPPASLLVEREHLRSVLQRDLLENLDHGVQVFKRIE